MRTILAIESHFVAIKIVEKLEDKRINGKSILNGSSNNGKEKVLFCLQFL